MQFDWDILYFSLKTFSQHLLYDTNYRLHAAQNLLLTGEEGGVSNC